MSAATNAEFLAAMFAELPDDTAAAMVCRFAGDPLTVDRGAWFARPWRHGDTISDAALNGYVAVSSFQPDPTLGEYRRRKANFARLHAVMLDDLGDGPGAKLPMRHADRLPVSALVETSPRNFQAWLFLEPSTDTDDRVTAELLIERMVDQGLAAATDPGMRGVTRFGRLPIGVNGKAKYLHEGRPFGTRLLRWDPDFRYTVREVARAFRLDLTPRPEPARRPVTLPDAHDRIDGFAGLFAAIVARGLYLAPLGEGRHAIRCPWLDSHTDRAESGTALLEPGPQNNWAGGFKCHHGHCTGRGIGDVYRLLGGSARCAA